MHEEVTRLFIVDPNLIDAAGHYLQHATAISEEAVSRGILVTWVTAASFDITLAPDFVQLRRIFTHNIFDEFHSNEEGWVLNNFNQYNQYFYGLLVSLGLHSVDRSIFLFSNVLHNQLYAIENWSQLLPEHSYAVCILRWNNATMDYNRTRGATAAIEQLYRYCLSNQGLVSRKIFMASDTVRLAHYYQSLGSGVSVHVLPNPQVAGQIRDTHRTTYCDGPVSIGCFGSFSRLRGSQLISEIMDSILRVRSDVRFICQVQDLNNEDSKSIVTLQNRYRHNVIILAGILDARLYSYSLASTSLILMPYCPAFYEFGSSGVACEALTFGIPAVLPSDTTIHDEFEAAGAGFVEAQQWTSSAFAASTLAALNDLEQLRGLSSSASSTYIQKTSPGTFLDGLLGLPSSAA